MIVFKRTDSDDVSFCELVKELDNELRILDGDEHVFYAQLNTTNSLQTVIVAYENDQPVGCGALREYAAGTMEVKRMFVPLHKRRQGIASGILNELENWSKELGYKKCILETGKKQPEAIELYKSKGYKTIPNFGYYKSVDNSVCFEKDLTIEQH